jgi:diguanylate cyclase (GGDEF)-like protein/PAS domain S-box-containing protein
VNTKDTLPANAGPTALTPPAEPDNPWRLALEGSDAGIWDWDLVTGQQTHSRRWEEMLGYAAGELRQGFIEFSSRLHPEDLAGLNEAISGYLAGKTSAYTADIRLRCKDGGYRWIVSRGMIVSRDLDGKPLRMIGTHTDISERKWAESELRALNQQLVHNAQLLERTLASTSQGILMLDANDRVSTFNPRMCELLDLPEPLLASHPTVQELVQFQYARGDFGPQAQLVEQSARAHVVEVNQGAKDNQSHHFLRTTRSGRTLEVKSQAVPGGGMVRTFTDVSNYVQAEAARQNLSQLLSVAQSLARIGGWEIDLTHDRVTWTEGVYPIFDTSPDEFQPTTRASTSRFFTPEALRAVNAIYGDKANLAGEHAIELPMLTATGRPIWVYSKGTSTWVNGREDKRTTVLQDITERKLAQAAMQATEARWKLALESTGDGMWDWHLDTGEEFFSKHLKAMYGFAEDELPNLAEELDRRTHPDDMAQLKLDRQAHFDGLTPTYTNEHRIHCKNGRWKWVLTRGMVISRDAQGRPLRMIGTHTDITERKQAEVRVWQQAHFDLLTGLPNRRMLRDRLEQEIKRSKRDTQQLGLLFIDLDHFKEVNDTLGHDSGDVLLMEAARRIQACVRDSDTVARMGGDEFTLILTELPDSASLTRTLQALLSALSAVFQIGAEQVFVSASIGITLYPGDGLEVEDLFRNADQALYVAKGEGRNRFSFFTPALQEAAQTRVRLANDLRLGLSEAQFRVVYQPIVELATGAVHKAEALIRWQHPSRGLVSPAEFIPIAEASGLIVEIGEWVFQQAAQQVQAWRAAGRANFQISVNKSPVQFHHHGSANLPWCEQLQAMGLPGDCLVVEITEGLLLDTHASVIQHLLDLRDAGVGVSLDDFGTGYSSLSYLQRFDIDFIKIDQSFVRHLTPGCTDLALCKAIILMAHELGIKVVAEGVETEQQRDLLLAAGCDYAQGYWFARPMPASDFEVFLAAQ